MAGHSHAHNVKFRKDRVDAKRGIMFSKAARQIIVAARSGSDVASNIALKYAVDYAKSLSMPKDTIERAIKKGSGELGGITIESCVYEAIGPGGVFILIEILTDNRNRIASEIRKILEMKNARLGSVAWSFEQKGIILVPAKGVSEDRLLEIILEAGAEDMERVDDTFMITTEVGGMETARAALTENGVNVESAEFAQIPKTSVPVDEETGRKLLDLVDLLDDNDDVQRVYYNFELPEALLAKMS